jgi:hypothetical protein
MEANYRRLNITIREDQYALLTERGVNISGLIRDLLGDYLSQSRITLQVSEETRRLYELVVANTGATDHDIEPPLRTAMAQLLERRIDEMQALHQKLVSQPSE